MLVPEISQVPSGQFQVLTYAVTSSIIGTNRTLISMKMKPHDSQKSLTQFPDSFTD
jgi:hypothetical protein